MSVEDLVEKVLDAIVNPIIVLLFSWAFLMFLWGVFEFVSNTEDQTKKGDGKRHMFWGIIGMAIMIAAIGIVGVLQNTVNSLS